MKYSSPKTLNVFLSLAACLLSFSSCNPGDTTPPPIPQPTPKGTPTGAATSQTIGPAGGIVSTPDGKISLTFPANALPSDTDIVIQPITDEAPGGLGNSYRLEPEGATFAQPVEVAFSYTDADLLGSSTDALGIAYQDDEGFWHKPTATLDPARREIKVQTTHFSNFSFFADLQLLPGSETVEVGKSVELRVVYCEKVVQAGSTGPGGILITLLGPCEESDRVFNKSSEWSVNGTRGGSATMGRVTVGAGRATYTAPLQKPPDTANPVAVSTRFTTKDGKTLLVSNITVVDAIVGWHGTISYTMKGDKTVKDSAVSEVDGYGERWESTETFFESDDGSITVASDNSDDRLLMYTAGAGTFIYSNVRDYKFTEKKHNNNGDCTYQFTENDNYKVSGPSSVQGTGDAAYGYVNIQPDGPDGSYEIVFSTLGGEITGHDVFTFTSSATSQDCQRPPLDNYDHPLTWLIHKYNLTIKGIIDPKQPNVLHGNQPVEVISGLVNPEPLKGTVTWDLTR